MRLLQLLLLHQHKTNKTHLHPLLYRFRLHHAPYVCYQSEIGLHCFPVDMQTFASLALKIWSDLLVLTLILDSTDVPTAMVHTEQNPEST